MHNGMEFCTSIADLTTAQRLAAEATEEGQIVELRGDMMGIGAEEIAALCGHLWRVVFTFHSPDQSAAEELYEAAIRGGAWAIDISLERSEPLINRLRALAKSHNVRLILSQHYTSTPTIAQLEECAHKAYSLGADIAKIITTAHTTAEAMVPIGLYDKFPPQRLISFAMGERGQFSRRLSLLRGAPYTYISPAKGEATAAGQPTREQLLGELRGGYSLEGLILPNAPTLPSSKSEVQRAVVLSLLSEGVSLIHNFTHSEDAAAALRVAERLGAKVSIDSSTLRIEGGVRRAFEQGSASGDGLTLQVGESALLGRMMLPIVATLCRQGAVTIEGCGSLLTRPMDGDLRVLDSLGVRYESENRRFPVRIHYGGTLKELIEVDGSHSSQTITGLIMACALSHSTHTIRVFGATSRPYILLTAEMLTKFGTKVELSDSGKGHLDIRVEGGGLRATEIWLKGDWSSAAYFAAAYAIAKSGENKYRRERYELLIERGTTQADEAIIDILRSAGANIVEEEQQEEGLCRLCFLPSDRLRAFEYDALDSPDLIPTLAAVALFADGESRIGGIGRLAGKESNRTEAIVSNLMAMGADIRIEGDSLLISSGAPLHPAPLFTYGDHRIAMALTIVGLMMPTRPTIDNAACVAKSFATFFELLGAGRS